MMMATSNGGDLFNGWPEDGEPVELGEPDVIRNEDNILWLRAEIERLRKDRLCRCADEVRCEASAQIASLAAAVNTMHKEAIEQEAEIERLECDLAISRGKHTNAIAEIERLRERLEMYPVKLTTGEVDRGELLSESCDGIACRDETIKLLEAEIERLEKV
jgi:chromosome segregation ATPase